MEYERPEITEVSLGVKGAKREKSGDGPSKCSNSCCYYYEDSTW